MFDALQGLDINGRGIYESRFREGGRQVDFALWLDRRGRFALQVQGGTYRLGGRVASRPRSGFEPRSILLTSLLTSQSSPWTWSTGTGVAPWQRAGWSKGDCVGNCSALPL